MKITDLKVSGFKSFVDPVHLRIEPGLTGIVGPNGCGKSNVLESLRWVMGATSARALRGGEMDDVIFAGTDRRPQRDIAEVLITIDNADGRAPAPFDTAPVLEISRRIRRAAGSTFRINGKEVRARDVQILFADASTGANSPSLVRQGQVSELINAKPENRRRILEEAAGIAGLYARRHEAELKLRGAETNLERLDHILIHMDEQLATLRKQAKQAARYRVLADEIRGLEAFLLAARLAAAQAGEAEARAAVDAAGRALADATIAAEQARKAVDGAEAAVEPARLEQSAADMIMRRLDGQRMDLDRQLAAAREAVSAAEADLRRIATDMGREDTLKADAQIQIERLTAELAGLPQDGGHHEAIAAARAEAERLDAARAGAEAALTAALSQQAAREAEVRGARRALDEAAAQSLRRNQILTQREAEEARQRAALPASTQIEALGARVAAATTAAEQAASAADTAEKEADRLSAAEQEAREAARTAQAALDRLKSEISGLEALSRQGPKAAAGVPLALDRTRPAPGYERALAAALGEDIEAALDRSAPSAWTGRAGQDFSWPPGVSPLAPHVEAPPELAGRLSSIGVADEAVFAQLGELPAGMRVVTLAGDLRRWDGFVRRKEAVSRAAVLLEQRNRLEALRRDLPQAEAAQATTAKASAEARAAADGARARARALRGEAPRAFAGLSQAREELSRAEAAQARAQSAVEQAAAAAAEARAEATAAAEAVAAATKAHQALADQIAAADTASLTALEQAAGAARSAAAGARGELARLVRAEADETARRRQLADDVQRWGARAADASARIEALEAERFQAETRRSGAQALPGQIEDRRRALMGEAPRAEARKRAADDALAAAETAVRAARDQARESDNALGSAREARAGSEVRAEAASARLADVLAEITRTLDCAPDELDRRARAGLGDAWERTTQDGAERQLARALRDRETLGGVNLTADEQAAEQEERVEALKAEREDLTQAIARLRGAVDEINAEGRERLVAAFDVVHGHFRVLFETLFDGGTAELRLTESDDPLGGGLEVYACPPGKKLQSMSLMSGGEQALTATALIFAVFLSNPAPICVLDEVDAPLDDSNVDRYCRMLAEMRRRTDTRFLVITHHPITMARMDRLFGVTMAERGVSQLVAVDLSRAEQLIAAE